MKDQHTLIKGYRDLSQEEIDLINRIKIAEALTLELCRDVKKHLAAQTQHAIATLDETEVARIDAANAPRWLHIGLTHVEQGFMALVRSVAQPAPSRINRSEGLNHA